MTRTILHADLDAFYASVEQRDDPSLRGRPLIVGGAAPRGVVCAASYEARKYGVRSAIPTVRAMQLCPHAILLRPRMGHYARVSERFFEILKSYTPRVEALSLDEAFLDVTASRALFGDGPTLARTLRQRVREELQLVVSVGVAPNKFVAKIASDVNKPDGLCIVDPADVLGFLHPLPVSRLWGVGEVTAESLGALGLRTIGDLAALGTGGLAVLTARLGADRAQHLYHLALGEDGRDVEPERTPVSVGSENTFDNDLRDRGELRPHLLDQADEACARLRRMGLRARTVTVKVKYADHRLVTRRAALERPTADQRLVGETACRLMGEVPSIERLGVRLTGVTLSGLQEPARQLVLDEQKVERGEHLGDTLDKIASRFGRGTVKRAVHLDDE